MSELLFTKPVLPDLSKPDALVVPTFWHCPDYAVTIGPEGGDLMRLFNYGPNPEQQLILDASFGMDRFGKLMAFLVFIVACRQNFKTGLLIMRGVIKALLLQRPLQVWTAHKESATDQAFAEFVRMAEECEEFGRRVRRFHSGKGSKAVEFTNGCKIVFRPRTGKAGQSMSADDVDLDEYFAVTPAHLGSLVPTMSTRPFAQVGGVSSAAHEDSDEQRAIQKRGRLAALGLTHEPRLVYGEWSVQRQVGVDLDGSPIFGPPSCADSKCQHVTGSVGCIADDRQLIKLANPSTDRSAAPSISWDYLKEEARTLRTSPESVAVYFRERLGAGSETAVGATGTIFGPASNWTKLRTTMLPDGTGAVGLAMSADQGTVALVGASVVEIEDPEDPEAEPIDLIIVAPIMHTTDVDAAIAELARIQDEHDSVVAYDEKGPASTLEDDLDNEDVAAEGFDITRYAKACAKFTTRVNKASLLYLENAEFDKHIGAAAWRWIGDLRVIGRREGQESIDTTLLEAAIFAVEAAESVGPFQIISSSNQEDTP